MSSSGAGPGDVMRSPTQLRTWAEAKYRAGHRGWLGLHHFGEECQFTWPLRPPTASVAEARTDAVSAWVTTWRRHRWPLGVEADIEWQTVAWRGLGRQTLPQRVRVVGAASLARLAQANEWVSLVAVARRLQLAWPDDDLSGVFPRIAGTLLDLDGSETTRFVEVVNWLVVHPESGLLPRELPIIGVDGKWLERHRHPVELLKAAVTGSSDLGLAVMPTRYSVRVLDPAIPGISERQPLAFAASVPELNRLPWRPDWVLVVENLQTLEALPFLPAVLAVFGKGNEAAGLAEVDWVKAARHLLYWGDLDTHGFRILGLVRQRLPQTESILMDKDTLRTFMTLAVVEPKPVAGPIGHLTQAELAALSLLRSENLRLEQERITISYARAVIESRLNG